MYIVHRSPQEKFHVAKNLIYYSYPYLRERRKYDNTKNTIFKHGKFNINFE